MNASAIAHNIQTVHLIYGSTGAGKSTYARKLAAEKNAVRFAIDEWMHGLFGQDKPEKMTLDWAMARVRRCEALIWQASLQILAAGRDVVLELGTMREQDRDRVKSMADAAGYAMAFWLVEADLALRKERVMRRNAERGETYSFEITPAMFDAIEIHFEAPTKNERMRSVTINGEMPHV